MQRTRILLVLCTGLIIASLLLWWKLADKEAPQQQTSKTLVFPHLSEQLDKVKHITVRHGNEQFAIQEKHDAWVIEQRNQYPVDLNAVRQVLYGMAELVKQQAKTTNPVYFTQLGLHDISPSNTITTQYILQDANQKPIASLLIGNTKSVDEDTGLSWFYVREPQHAQSWLVSGLLPVYQKPGDWFSAPLITISYQQTTKLSLQQPGKKAVILAKDTSNKAAFKLVSADNSKLISPLILENLVKTLARLKAVDVLSKDQLSFANKKIIKAQLVSSNGLTIDYQILRNASKYYVKLSAKASANTDILQKQISELNNKLAPWVFEINEFDFKQLQQDHKDFLK